MKLIIFFKGDQSVGIFPAQYELECPFEKEDTDQTELDFFKKEAIQLYAEFDSASGAMYDFEIEEQEKMYMQSIEQE